MANTTNHPTGPRMALSLDGCDTHDLAYAAGMIDGDGCVSVNKSSYIQKGGGRSYMITVRVSQKLPEIPEWFASKFGGKVRIMGKGKTAINGLGKTVFFPPLYSWELTCNNAANFLEAILPFLLVKKERSGVAIKLARLHRSRGGRGFRYGGVPVTLEENEERHALALLIRAENQKGNTRVAMTSTWGIA